MKSPWIRSPSCGHFVFGIFRFGQFVVFNTTNGRTHVERLDEAEKTEVMDVPEELYADVLDNSNRIIGEHGQAYNKVYLQKTRGDQAKIFVMDTKNGLFTQHVLHKREESNSYAFWRNQAGDLLEEVTDDETGETVYRVLETSKLF